MVFNVSYVVSFVAVVFTSLLGSYFTAKNTKSEWYRCIKPKYLTPPGWVFPIVWTTLYFILFLVLGRAIKQKNWVLSGLMLISLVLNVVWCWLYFGERMVNSAMFVIGVLVALAFAMVIYSWSQGDRHAAKMLLPYTAWLCFASLLNYMSIQKVDICKHLML